MNNINNKIYVGSSINLTTRFYKYYSVKNLTLHNTIIHNALLKYGFSNFTLAILEYLSNKEDLIGREQHYINLLKPGYNILEQAGSSLGYKHREETLKLFKKRKLTEEARNNLSIAATGRVLSEEVKEKISNKRKGIRLSEETRTKISDAAVKLVGVKINVINIETDESLYFDSLTNAANYLNVSRTAISKVLRTGKTLKKVYVIKANIE
jgi:group I intron endonuclease